MRPIIATILPWARASLYKIGINKMKPAIIYIYCSHDPKHRDLAFKFVDSCLTFPPNCKHRTIIACQTGRPDWMIHSAFSQLPDVEYYDHDDSGWDIGAYQAIAKTLVKDTPLMVCFGGTAHFRKSGWLLRMVEAWQKYGEGFYGGKATYEVSPHLNTCGFWTSPRLLAEYPIKVETKRQRYDFEHGPNAMWKRVFLAGLPAKYVTWTEELDWPDWRKPLNGFRCGDQSDCLTRWWLNEHYDKAEERLKPLMQKSCDVITDPFFKALINPEISEAARADLVRKSLDRLDRTHKFL